MLAGLKDKFKTKLEEKNEANKLKAQSKVDLIPESKPVKLDQIKSKVTAKEPLEPRAKEP